MIFAETSFFCALLRTQENSHLADNWMAAHPEPIFTTTLIFYEFRQGIHFQNWLFRHDRKKGYPVRETTAMLARLEENLALGIFRIAPVDWTAVHDRAGKLAAKHTPASGARGFNLLHVATALELKARHFLSFDENQRTVAAQEGLSFAPGV